MTEKPIPIRDQKWPKGIKPVVSIFCLTYNHEKFIRDAIEGFLMQETTFPVEIFIHDDASTDQTVPIIKEYARKYPELIKTKIQEVNQYSQIGFRFVFDYLSSQNGEFVAICEGDDYWIQPDKIQKQWQQLNENKNCMISAGIAQKTSHIRQGNEEEQKILPNKKKLIYDLKEILKSYEFHTSTFFMRTANIKNDHPLVKCKNINGDLILMIMLTEQGPLAFLDETLSAYRQHNEGWVLSKKPSEMCERFSRMMGEIDKYFHGNYRTILKERRRRELKGAIQKWLGEKSCLFSIQPVPEAAAVFLETWNVYDFKLGVCLLRCWFRNQISLFTQKIAIRSRIKKMISDKT